MERLQRKQGLAAELTAPLTRSSPRLLSIDRSFLYGPLTSGEGDSPHPPAHLRRVLLIPHVAVGTVPGSKET